MPIYISLFEPKKKALVNGAVALVIALDAPNKKAAEGIAIGKLYEKYPESVDNFFGRKLLKIRPDTLVRLLASSMKSLPLRTLSTATYGRQKSLSRKFHPARSI